jgi:DNA polymerase I-like protein with 3'-5' exonuclease and polymerase domains
MRPKTYHFRSGHIPPIQNNNPTTQEAQDILAAFRASYPLIFVDYSKIEARILAQQIEKKEIT